MAGQCVGVRWITEAYIKHITTHTHTRSPNCLEGLLHSGPICSFGQTNIKENGSLDNSETSQSVNLRHAGFYMHAFLFPAPTDTLQSRYTSVGSVCMLVWCESVQSCVTVPPQLEDCGAHMWSVSASAYPMWTQRGSQSRYSCHCGESYRTEPGDAGSASKWVCCSCGEMSWEDLDSADERGRECGGTGTQHGSEWRRSGLQVVVPAYAPLYVLSRLNSDCKFWLWVPTPD